MPFQVSQRRTTEVLNDRSITIPTHQRAYVWDSKRGSAFIDTVMNNLPTHALFLYQTVVDGEICRYLEDGHQRFMTLRYFVTGDPIGVNILWNGKRFEDFTTVEQNLILNYMLTINVMENISHDDRIMLFQRLQDGKALTSGQRFAALTDKPLVQVAQQIINNERCHDKWGYHKETKSKTILANAIAIAAGLVLPNDDHITSSYEIIGPEIFTTHDINNDIVAHRLQELLSVYEIADLHAHIKDAEKKKQFKVGLYTGYIVYTMRQATRNWEADKQMWADYIVRVRKEPSAIAILKHNAPPSRNWNKERWEQGLWNIEHIEEVTKQLQHEDADTNSLSDDD